MSNPPWFFPSWLVAGLLFTLALGSGVWIAVAVRRLRSLNQLAEERDTLVMQVQKLQASLEEETQRRLVQGQLLISFSHDLRQPLQAIAAHRSMLSERLEGHQGFGSEGQRVGDGLSGISACLQIANELVESALDTERLANNSISPRHEVLEIEAFCRDFVEQLRPLATSFHSEVQLYCWQPQETCVSTDPRLLGRILRNLLINALRHADGRRIRLTIRLRQTTCRVAVLDNGMGMTAEVRKRLRQGFRSSIPSYVLPNAKGSGLGLLISRQLASSIGARLGVSSHLAHGSGFFLDLPVCPPSEAAAIQAAMNPNEPYPKRSCLQDKFIVWVQHASVGLDAKTDATLEAFRLALKAEGYGIIDSMDGSLRVTQLEGLKDSPFFIVIVSGEGQDVESAITHLRDEFNEELPVLELALEREKNRAWDEDRSVIQITPPYTLKKLKAATLRLQTKPIKSSLSPVAEPSK